VIDFRYHLVSIVAVFLALAIGIVLGSTELQGATLDGLRQTADSLRSQLSNASNNLSGAQAQINADQKFYATAEPRLLAQTLTGDRIVIVAEPGAPDSVINGIKQAAGYAGAAITGTVVLENKFNDLSGATGASLEAINAEQAATYGTVLSQPADTATVNQDQAAQLIATAILEKTTTAGLLTTAEAQTLLSAYAQGGYLTTVGSPYDPATLAVVVTPGSAPSDGASDPGNQVLLALAQEFAEASAATVVTGSSAGSSPADSAISVLRSSSVSSEVSSVDNADTTLGQISAMWALANQLAGVKPGSYGVSGASAVSPEPAATPTATATATPTATTTPSTKATGKAKNKK